MCKLLRSSDLTIVILSFYITSCVTINFDLNYVDVISSANKDDYFGYSVLMQRGNPSNLIVGAPKSNSTFANHVNIKEPGVVYRCIIKDQNLCSQLILDKEGNSELNGYDQRFNYKNKKDRGLLGAAIDGGETVEEPIIVCSPKWTNDRLDRNGQHYLVNGRCYLFHNSQNVNEDSEKLMPLLDAGYQGKQVEAIFKYNYAMGEAGMSVQYLSKENQLLIGAPGVLSWMGTTIRYKNVNSSTYKSSNVPDPEMLFNIKEESTYFGYSVSSGNFRANSDDLWYVAGAPRAKNLFGLVLLYEFGYYNNEALLVHNSFIGDQFGAYFGSSVLSVDITANNASDLLVGAPSYYAETWDEGCVYFYKNDGEGKFRSPLKIFGNKYSGARFGATISSIGDINYDLYQDIAIAAPYEEEQGVVYIFLGNVNGLSLEYSQKISARQIDKSLRGFGYSLSRGVDIDENLYNDIAVGAYKSGQVAIIKSRPIIQYKAELSPSLGELPLETTNFNVTYCLSYLTTTSNIESVRTDIHLIADYRTLNNGNIVRTEKLVKDQIFCDTTEISLKPLIYDFTKPYKLEMIYTIATTSNTEFCPLCPITNPSEANSFILNIPFANGCGKDNVCQPDLKVSAHFENNLEALTIGAMDSIKLNVRIENNGEPAFLTQFHMYLPTDLEILRFASTCELDENRLYTCLIDNALQPKKYKDLSIDLDVRNLNPRQTHLELNLTLESKGEEINQADNSLQLKLPIKLENDINIIGKSYPDQILYIKDKEQNTVKSKEVNFTHEFLIGNNGPSPLIQSLIYFYIPTNLKTNEAVFDVHEPEVSVDGIPIFCTSNLLGLLEDNSETLESESIRLKRDTSKEVKQPIVTYTDFPIEKVEFVNCSSSGVNCLKVDCASNETVFKNKYISAKILITAQIKDMDTLLGKKDVLLFSSIATVEANGKKIHNYAQVIINGSRTLENSQVSYWIYILCVVIALLILGIVVFILYKLNFFHRPVREKLVNDFEELSEGPSVVRSLEEDDHDERYN